MSWLLKLPYELLSNIVLYLDFDDIFSLIRTCTYLSLIYTDQKICKQIIETKLRFSKEARSAKTAGYAVALRSAAKRREALATASPFTVAIVAVGDSYIYCKGVLCYILDDRVRVLDLHNSGQHETVISIPGLLTQAIEDTKDKSRGVFRLLYYSDNIISSLYKSSDLDETAWLVACNKNTKEILVVEDLSSTNGIFVRHNSQYLYYGTHSEIGNDNHKRWAIKGFNFECRKWFPEKICLLELVGSEIGSRVCFEFYKEYFYALSNQSSFDVEEIDWTSFYHCVRFPLNSPSKELLEKTENESMWRREDPIDDRWTSLCLDEDETTGELKIVESRKEWRQGSSRSQITYYKTNIIFPTKEKELDFAYIQPFPPSCSSIAASWTIKQDRSSLPDDSLLLLLRSDDNPHFVTPPPRLPQNTHPRNDGSHMPIFAKYLIRHYHPSTSTYIDLINDPDPGDWKGTQRLRLRAGSRRLGPPLTHQSGVNQGLPREPSSDLGTALKEVYREKPIAYWPPTQNPGHADEDLDALYRLLNPPSHLGNVQGTADERSLVYITGGCDKPRAIVLVSFDPTMKLLGLKKWGGLCRKSVGEGPHIDGRATEYLGGNEKREVGKTAQCVDEADRTVAIDRKGKGNANCVPVVQVSGDANVKVDVALEREQEMGVQKRSWAWVEEAMYKDIGNGFDFGLSQKRG